MPVDISVELIASVVSLGIALLTAFFAHRADRERRRHEDEQSVVQRSHEQQLDEVRRSHEERLRKLQSDLDALSAERDARIDYEYEARKNLYTSVAPLSFHLSELGDSALGRITGLARTARHGDLGPTKRSWLGSEGYFFTSTLYRLLAPLAVGELIRRKLTAVDVGLDKYLALQYRLIRRLTASFSDDYRLAAYTPEIPYRPDHSPSGHGDELGNVDELRRQGVYTGWLEQARDSLIRRDSEDEAPRVINYGEFEALYDKGPDDIEAKALHRLRYLLHDFHPERHGVLWRMLVVQGHLYRAFSVIRDAQLAGEPVPEQPIRPLPDNDLRALDYDNDRGAPSADAPAVKEVTLVAHRYLSDCLPDLVAKGSPKA
jgi:hypothetical protein